MFELRYLELLLWLALVGPSTGALGSRDGLPLGKMSAPASEGMPCSQYLSVISCFGTTQLKCNVGDGNRKALPEKKCSFPTQKYVTSPEWGKPKTWPRPQGASRNTVAVPASAPHSWAGTAPSAAPSLKGWRMKENNNKKRKPWQYHEVNLWISMGFPASFHCVSDSMLIHVESWIIWIHMLDVCAGKSLHLDLSHSSGTTPPLWMSPHLWDPHQLQSLNFRVWTVWTGHSGFLLVRPDH